MQPNSWPFTRSAWIRKQRCCRESTILILLVRYRTSFTFWRTLHFPSLKYSIAVQSISLTLFDCAENCFFLTLNFIFLTSRFSCFHHGSRWLQMSRYGVRGREIPQWPYREEEGGRPEGISCCRHREGGAACSSWTSGTWWVLADQLKNWKQLANISGACLLLQYLHNEKKLLHGDMKSCNVVIKGDFESIKICDVGVSLQLDENMKGEDSGVQVAPLTD